MKLSTFSNQNRLQTQMYLEKVGFVIMPTRHNKEGLICFEVDADYQFLPSLYFPKEYSPLHLP